MLQYYYRGVMLTSHPFQRAPTLGGECYQVDAVIRAAEAWLFQRAPTLGGECYQRDEAAPRTRCYAFQRAPTLGGECYEQLWLLCNLQQSTFQRAPTLGGECYISRITRVCVSIRFNGHPPLGVNAT